MGAGHSSGARAARVAELLDCEDGELTGAVARASRGELADALTLAQLSLHLERDALGLCELRLAHLIDNHRGGAMAEGKSKPAAEEAGADANGKPLDPEALYVAAQPLVTLADKGEEVFVAAGNRRPGDSPLVRSAPSLWYREGDEPPPPPKRAQPAAA